MRHALVMTVHMSAMLAFSSHHNTMFSSFAGTQKYRVSNTQHPIYY